MKRRYIFGLDRKEKNRTDKTKNKFFGILSTVKIIRGKMIREKTIKSITVTTITVMNVAVFLAAMP